MVARYDNTRILCCSGAKHHPRRTIGVRRGWLRQATKKEEPAGMQCRRALLFVIHYVIQSVLLAGPEVQLPSLPCFLETCRQERFLSLSAQAATHAKYRVLWCADERVHLVSQAFLRINLVLVDGAHHLPQRIGSKTNCSDATLCCLYGSTRSPMRLKWMSLLIDAQRLPMSAESIMRSSSINGSHSSDYAHLRQAPGARSVHRRQSR